ncbi:hypothetical protein QQ045_024606 [Rhodiola kirilowii]
MAASYALSRFSFDRKGSALWKSVSSLIIAELSYHSRWILGRGNTLVKDFCSGVAVSCPSNLYPLTISEVLNNPNLKKELIDCSGPVLIQSTYWEQNCSEDRLIWEGNSSGVFNVKDYWKYIFGNRSISNNYSSLWQKWIPPKITGFVWKLMSQPMIESKV